MQETAPSGRKISARQKSNGKSRNIGLWLDTYDEIFSDFDPRPFEARAISDDFLSELQKMAREGSDGVSELQLLIPEDQRDPESEATIVHRIRSHFRKRHHEMENEVRRLRITAAVMTFCGVLLSLVAGWLATLRFSRLQLNLLLVILEPAGWFLIWNGLDTLYTSLRRKKPELEYYGKMIRCKIVFQAIENDS